MNYPGSISVVSCCIIPQLFIVCDIFFIFSVADVYILAVCFLFHADFLSSCRCSDLISLFAINNIISWKWLTVPLKTCGLEAPQRSMSLILVHTTLCSSLTSLLFLSSCSTAANCFVNYSVTSARRLCANEVSCGNSLRSLVLGFSVCLARLSVTSLPSRFPFKWSYLTFTCCILTHTCFSAASLFIFFNSALPPPPPHPPLCTCVKYG